MTHLPVHDWFSKTARRHPDAVALEWEDVSLSYGELDLASTSLALRLRALRPGLGSRVAVLLERRIDVVAALLAVLKAGHVFVYLDPALPLSRLVTLAEIAAVDILLFDEHSSELVGQMRDGAPSIAAAAALDLADARGGITPQLSCGGLPPDGPAYICFTSGSTGTPKPILGRLRSIDHFVAWESATLPVRPGVRVSQFTHPGFDAFLRDVFVPLCSGGTLCIPEHPMIVTMGQRALEWLATARVQLVHCVPSLLRSMLSRGGTGSHRYALEHVLLAGEPLLPDDVRSWLDHFGDHVEIINLYGPSETTMTKLFHRVTRADAARQRVPIGRPIDDTAICVVDDHGVPVPQGEIGELLIATPYASLGYFRQPEPTAAAFIASPLPEMHPVAYRTGDLARVVGDGLVEFMGRRDRQIKVRGVRVELEEIELMGRTHSGVRDMAVVVECPRAGEELIHAFVIAPGLTEVEVRRHMSDNLPAYMIPGRFTIVETLPRTINGKIDRRKLFELTSTVGVVN